MSADNFVEVIAITLLLAHVAIALWLRGQIGWAIALNLLVSAGVVAYWLPNISDLSGSIPLVQIFIAYEFVVLVVSAAALLVRVPPAILWAAFAVHAAFSAAAVIFMFTFRMTRLM